MGKYWFDYVTGTDTIAPIQRPFADASMNEEIRHASDLAKDPASYSAATYLLVLLLSMWGGLVRVIREVRLGGKSAGQIALIFLASVCVSGFAGFLTFFVLDSSGLRIGYSAAMAGVAGYMGGRAIDALEAVFRTQIAKGPK